MPRGKQTRKVRAQELLKLAERGPHLVNGFAFDRNVEMQKEAENHYRIWSQTWLLPEMKRLIPELNTKD